MRRIELTERQYTELLRLVMVYGSGTGLGTSTSTELRTAIGEARQVSAHRDLEDE